MTPRPSFLMAVGAAVLVAVTHAADQKDEIVSRASVTNGFHPLVLEPYYKRLLSYYRTPEPRGAWGFVPQGLTNFDGVPFRITGYIELTGLGPARDKNFHPTRVGEIPVGARAARLHLIHGAAYDDPEGTPISSVVLHYKDGEERRLSLRYGVHVRNWYVERSERSARLQDLRSSIIWNGNTRADGLGTPTRLFKTTLSNPRPGEEIRALELLSLFGRANSVILAITLEEGQGIAARTADSVAENEGGDTRSELLLRTLEMETGGAVSNVVVEADVTESGRRYSWGTYRSDRHGQVLIDYPSGRFQEIRFSINDLVRPRFVLGLTNEDGIFPAELPVRVKRSSMPVRFSIEK